MAFRLRKEPTPWGGLAPGGAGAFLAFVLSSPQTRTTLPMTLAAGALVGGATLLSGGGRLALPAVAVFASAFLSGPSAGADGMLAKMITLGVPPEVAPALVFYLRKGIHLSAYGTLGLLFRWAGLSPGWALGAVAGVALGDEVRQMGVANRGGSLADVALDLTGAAIFLGVAEVVRRRRDARSAGGTRPG